MAVLNSVRLYVLKLKRKIVDFFFETPTFLFVITIPLWMIGMYFINKIYGIEWKDIWSNADGVVFDLIIFGALFSFYEWIRSKRERIKHYEEEIDDYRGWDEKEATYRIVGAIRRLKREGVSQIDLKKCYLVNADLPNAILTNSDLSGANLEGADLSGAILIDVNLAGANLIGANLVGAILTRAKLEGANLCKTNFSKADLTDADLTNATLSEFYTFESDPGPYDTDDDYYYDPEIEYSGFFQGNNEAKAANLSKATLLRTKFLGANLNYVDFFQSNLSEANMSNAELINARLTEANLIGTNLTKADLSGAYLNDAIVKTNWLEKINTNQVKGSNEIIQQYSTEELDGKIVLRKNSTI